jgi:signal transduction histidine kinase
LFVAARLKETKKTSSAGAHRAQKGAGATAVDFEALLSDLSAAFVRVAVDEIDREIEHWLERIVLATKVDRSTVVQAVPRDGFLYVTHQWARAGVGTPQRGIPIDRTPETPWLDDQIASGHVVVFSRLDDLPPEASTDREVFREGGTKSNVTIPLRVGEVVVGALLFGAVRFEKHWSEQEVQRLKLVAEIFGNAFERKRAEAEIGRLAEKLRQASQVMTMGELTASLAHELNQPLAAILNNAKAARRLLSAKTPDLIEIDAALDDIIRDDARAVDIVKNVRAMFQRGPAKMAPVDVRQLIVDVARIVSSDARMKEISWSLELPDSLPRMLGDKTHLTQAILSLVVNAFDSVCEGEGPREVVLRADQVEPNQVHVSVRDSGKGIDAQVIPNLFEAFYTTKPVGMGLGLTIVRSIIESHGGRIWATRNPVRGATLEFILPVQPNAQPTRWTERQEAYPSSDGFAPKAVCDRDDQK